MPKEGTNVYPTFVVFKSLMKDNAWISSDLEDFTETCMELGNKVRMVNAGTDEEAKQVAQSLTRAKKNYEDVMVVARHAVPGGSVQVKDAAKVTQILENHNLKVIKCGAVSGQAGFDVYIHHEEGREVDVVGLLAAAQDVIETPKGNIQHIVHLNPTNADVLATDPTRRAAQMEKMRATLEEKLPGMNILDASVQGDDGELRIFFPLKCDAESFIANNTEFNIMLRDNDASTGAEKRIRVYFVMKYQLYRSPSISDIFEGVNEGKIRVPQVEVVKDREVTMFLGVTQSGKTTTLAYALGLPMVVYRVGDVPVVGAKDPTRNPQHDLCFVELTHPDANKATSNVEPTAMKIPVPLGFKLAYEREVPAHARRNPFAVAGASLGESTTKDIFAFDLGTGEGPFIVDTPGTLDTEGLCVDVRNAYVKQKLFEKTRATKILITLQADWFRSAAGGELKDKVNTVIPYFSDFLEDCQNVGVLITRLVDPYQIATVDPSEYFVRLGAVITLAETLGNSSNLDMNSWPDKCFKALMQHIVSELRKDDKTSRKVIPVMPLLGDNGATVLQVIGNIKGLPSSRFATPLPQKGIDGLKKCIEEERCKFDKYVDQGALADANTILLNIGKVRNEIEEAKINYTYSSSRQQLPWTISNVMEDMKKKVNLVASALQKDFEKALTSKSASSAAQIKSDYLELAAIFSFIPPVTNMLKQGAELVLTLCSQLEWATKKKASPSWGAVKYSIDEMNSLTAVCEACDNGLLAEADQILATSFKIPVFRHPSFVTELDSMLRTYRTGIENLNSIRSDSGERESTFTKHKTDAWKVIRDGSQEAAQYFAAEMRSDTQVTCPTELISNLEKVSKSTAIESHLAPFVENPKQSFTACIMEPIDRAVRDAQDPTKKILTLEPSQVIVRMKQFSALFEKVGTLQQSLDAKSGDDVKRRIGATLKKQIDEFSDVLRNTVGSDLQCTRPGAAPAAAHRVKHSDPGAEATDSLQRSNSISDDPVDDDNPFSCILKLLLAADIIREEESTAMTDLSRIRRIATQWWDRLNPPDNFVTLNCESLESVSERISLLSTLKAVLEEQDCFTVGSSYLNVLSPESSEKQFPATLIYIEEFFGLLEKTTKAISDTENEVARLVQGIQAGVSLSTGTHWERETNKILLTSSWIGIFEKSFRQVYALQKTSRVYSSQLQSQITTKFKFLVEKFTGFFETASQLFRDLQNEPRMGAELVKFLCVTMEQIECSVLQPAGKNLLLFDVVQQHQLTGRPITKLSAGALDEFVNHVLETGGSLGDRIKHITSVTNGLRRHATARPGTSAYIESLNRLRTTLQVKTDEARERFTKHLTPSSSHEKTPAQWKRLITEFDEGEQVELIEEAITSCRVWRQAIGALQSLPASESQAMIVHGQTLRYVVNLTDAIRQWMRQVRDKPLDIPEAISEERFPNVGDEFCKIIANDYTKLCGALEKQAYDRALTMTERVTAVMRNAEATFLDYLPGLVVCKLDNREEGVPLRNPPIADAMFLRRLIQDISSLFETGLKNFDDGLKNKGDDFYREDPLPVEYTSLREAVNLISERVWEVCAENMDTRLRAQATKKIDLYDEKRKIIGIEHTDTVLIRERVLEFTHRCYKFAHLPLKEFRNNKSVRDSATHMTTMSTQLPIVISVAQSVKQQVTKWLDFKEPIGSSGAFDLSMLPINLLFMLGEMQGPALHWQPQARSVIDEAAAHCTKHIESSVDRIVKTINTACGLIKCESIEKLLEMLTSKEKTMQLLPSRDFDFALRAAKDGLLQLAEDLHANLVFQKRRLQEAVAEAGGAARSILFSVRNHLTRNCLLPSLPSITSNTFYAVCVAALWEKHDTEQNGLKSLIRDDKCCMLFVADLMKHMKDFDSDVTIAVVQAFGLSDDYIGKSSTASTVFFEQNTALKALNDTIAEHLNMLVATPSPAGSDAAISIIRKARDQNDSYVDAAPNLQRNLSSQVDKKMAEIANLARDTCVPDKIQQSKAYLEVLRRFKESGISSEDHVSGIIDKKTGPLRSVLDHLVQKKISPLLTTLVVDEDAAKEAISTSEKLGKVILPMFDAKDVNTMIMDTVAPYIAEAKKMTTSIRETLDSPEKRNTFCSSSIRALRLIENVISLIQAAGKSEFTSTADALEKSGQDLVAEVSVAATQGNLVKLFSFYSATVSISDTSVRTVAEIKSIVAKTNQKTTDRSMLNLLMEMNKLLADSPIACLKAETDQLTTYISKTVPQQRAEIERIIATTFGGNTKFEGSSLREFLRAAKNASELAHMFEAVKENISGALYKALDQLLQDYVGTVKCLGEFRIPDRLSSLAGLVIAIQKSSMNECLVGVFNTASTKLLTNAYKPAGVAPELLSPSMEPMVQKVSEELKKTVDTIVAQLAIDVNSTPDATKAKFALAKKGIEIIACVRDAQEKIFTLDEKPFIDALMSFVATSTNVLKEMWTQSNGCKTAAKAKILSLLHSEMLQLRENVDKAMLAPAKNEILDALSLVPKQRLLKSLHTCATNDLSKIVETVTRKSGPELLNSAGECAAALCDVRDRAANFEGLLDVAEFVISSTVNFAHSKCGDATESLFAALQADPTGMGDAVIQVSPELRAIETADRIKQAGKFTPEEVVDLKIEFNESVGQPEKTRLVELLNLNLKQRDDLLAVYSKVSQDAGSTQADENHDASIKELQREVRSTADLAKVKGLKQQEHLVSLIIQVAFAYTWINFGRNYVKDFKKDSLLQLHSIQLATIFVIFEAEQCVKESNLLNDLSKLNKHATDIFPRSHILEVLTGEGKSITLAVIAATLALLGFKADVVCYSKKLTERDEQDMRSFFVGLGIINPALPLAQRDVRYLTFQMVMQLRLGQVRTAALNVIRNTASNVPAPAETRRVLLIDEVDVFFDPLFYGEIYKCVARLVTVNIQNIVEAVFKKTVLSNVELLKPAVDELKNWGCDYLVPFLYQAVQRMREDIKDFGLNRSTTSSRRPEDYIVEGDDIGYIDSDGSPSFTLSFGFKTAFAMLEEMRKQRINPSDEIKASKMSLAVPVASFLYSAIPSKGYFATFGVTGTLRTLPETEKGILKSLCRVSKFTYTQSIYERQEVFAYQTNCVLHDTREEQHVAIDNIITQCMNMTNGPEGKKGYPAIIIWENMLRMDEFLQRFPKHESNVKKLTPEAHVDDVRAKVIGATLKGQITMMTREYGRGYDFKCKQCEQLSVVQTFFTASESEEVQIRGRTGRQGTTGQYYMHIVMDDLRKELTPSSELGKNGTEIISADAKTARNAAIRAEFMNKSMDKRNGSFFYKILDESRTKKLRLDLEARTAKAAESLKMDNDSAAMLGKIFNPAVKRKEKLDLLCGQCSFQKTSLIFMLDISGSMAWSLKGDLEMTAQDVNRGEKCRLDTLKNTFLDLHSTMFRVLNPASTNILIMPFHNSGFELYNGLLQDLPSTVLAPLAPQGGTEFAAAFSSLRQLMASPKLASFKSHSILMLTDGADQTNPITAIRDLTKVFDISSFYFVLFGPTAARNDKIFSTFAAAKVAATEVKAASATELLQGFEKFAESNAPEQGE